MSADRHGPGDRRADLYRLAGDHSRHWWQREHGNRHVPPIFALLTDEEWALMLDWFEATGDVTGEANIPANCILQALIEGNGLTRIVELGRFEGYTTLLLGFMLRRMWAVGGLISFDVAVPHTRRVGKWVKRAHLEPYVKIELGDSRDPESLTRARAHFGGQDPQLVFLDSSHAFDQTIAELDLWYDAVVPGGFIVCHDTSEFARRYDHTGRGGVKAGIRTWRSRHRRGVPFINLNVDAMAFAGLVYGDLNGLAIIQKPLTRPE